ncbi:ABC transporter substrate-binding protein [Hahella sp. CR1]|uniref:ABC transporter substrate-binding protein n=1 Tax=Hahella sp. CR1 TaxID=2992807 RepID=UPI0024427E84|nr:ABC transporter substrate-binding protein [Hahella sp. CR1]MDG9668715.1 ABC transporter substrate-binding protein [Hahella sp. CR1]
MFPEWMIKAPCFQGDSNSPLLALSESEGPNKQDLMIATLLAATDSQIPIRIRYYDNGRSAEKAVEVANQVVQDKCDAIIGHYSSVVALAASEVYEAEKLLFLAPGSSHPSLCEKKNYTLRFFGSDLDQLGCLAEAWKPLKSVLIIGQHNNYGERLATDLNRLLVSQGAGVKLKYLDIDSPSNQDIENNIKQSDCIYLLGCQYFSLQLLETYPFNKGSKIILSDDAKGPELNGVGYDNIFVAYPKILSDCLLEWPADVLCKRAAIISGRNPGPYFYTSYLAARVLTQAWHSTYDWSSSSVVDILRKKSWHTPYGDLALSNHGELEGMEWTLYGK